MRFEPRDMSVIGAILALAGHLAHSYVNLDSALELTRPPLLQIPIRSATLILPVVLNTQVVWRFRTAELMRDEMARVVAAAL